MAKPQFSTISPVDLEDGDSFIWRMRNVFFGGWERFYSEDGEGFIHVLHNPIAISVSIIVWFPE